MGPSSHPIKADSWSRSPISASDMLGPERPSRPSPMFIRNEDDDLMDSALTGNIWFSSRERLYFTISFFFFFSWHVFNTSLLTCKLNFYLFYSNIGNWIQERGGSALSNLYFNVIFYCPSVISISRDIDASFIWKRLPPCHLNPPQNTDFLKLHKEMALYSIFWEKSSLFLSFLWCQKAFTW